MLAPNGRERASRNVRKDVKKSAAGFPGCGDPQESARIPAGWQKSLQPQKTQNARNTYQKGLLVTKSRLSRKSACHEKPSPRSTRGTRRHLGSIWRSQDDSRQIERPSHWPDSEARRGEDMRARGIVPLISSPLLTSERRASAAVGRTRNASLEAFVTPNRKHSRKRDQTLGGFLRELRELRRGSSSSLPTESTSRKRDQTPGGFLREPRELRGGSSSSLPTESTPANRDQTLSGLLRELRELRGGRVSSLPVCRNQAGSDSCSRLPSPNFFSLSRSVDRLRPSILAACVRLPPLSASAWRSRFVSRHSTTSL